MQYRYFILSLSVFLFCVVTLIFWSKPEPPVQTIHFDCGAKFEGIGTIFGGEKAEQNSWPWLVAFLYVPKNSFFCGGSLISKRHVLSGKKIIN